LDDTKPNLNIPIQFQKLAEYEVNDTRFQKVKIWLMHLNENYNGSFFDKSIVEKALPSLANTPILIYVEKNSEGEKDASDHRSVLVKEDGQYKIKYIGQACGTIPESNNAKFEMRVCDDGIEREFVTVEGLLWTKFDDPIDIMNRDKVKAESMELDENYSGQFESDNLFHFTEFKFYGACILGKNVYPAMQNASIEIDFSYEVFHKEIQEKMEQFKQFSMTQSSTSEVDNISSNKEEGGKSLVDEKLELLKKYSLTLEGISFKIDELSLEEIESKIKEHFSMLQSQKCEELANALRVEKYKDRWGDEYSRYSYVDCKDNMVFAYDRQENWNLYGFTYSMNGDKVIIDFVSKIRKKFDIVDFVEGESIIFNLLPQEAVEYALNDREKEISQKPNADFDALKIKVSEYESTIEILNTEIGTLKTSNEELSNYKDKKELDIHTEKINEVFSDFEENLKDNEKYALLKSEVEKDIMKYNIENLKKDLLAILGELNFNKTTKKVKEKIVAPVINIDGNDVRKSRYGKYEKFIEESK